MRIRVTKDALLAELPTTSAFEFQSANVGVAIKKPNKHIMNDSRLLM